MTDLLGNAYSQAAAPSDMQLFVWASTRWDSGAVERDRRLLATECMRLHRDNDQLREALRDITVLNTKAGNDETSGDRRREAGEAV